MADPKASPEEEKTAAVRAAEQTTAGHEAALARLKLETAKDESERVKLSRPWWRSWNITALGALLAAIAPTTAGVTGYFEKQKQLALEEQKQRHEIAMAQQKQDEEIRGRYLDRIVDPQQSRRTLRLMIVSSTDEKIRQWAANELPRIDEEEKRNEAASSALLSRADGDEALLKKTLDSAALAKHLTQSIAELRKRASESKHIYHMPPD